MANAAEQAERLSYEGTIKTLLHTSRGAYENLDYLPVFRASGIFFAVVDANRTTIISFMNYWREKNDNDAVGALVTLRDSEGQRIARHYFQLDGFVYAIDAAELLDKADWDHTDERFEGSVELEFFSDKDLKFAFPALLVFYRSRTGISSVHTNQRTFNGREDKERGSRFNSWQTGFDIHFRDGARPFIYVVNGETTRADVTADLIFYNAEGARLDRRVRLGDLPAYASRKLDLAEINGAVEHLQTGVGFVKADIGLADVYCRFACGIEDSDGFIAATHSYFDCTGFEDYYDAAQFESNIYPCFVPVNLVKDVDVDVVFYPIQSPAQLKFSIQAFDEAGTERAWVEVPGWFETDGGLQMRLNPAQILRDNGADVGEEMVCIHIGSKDGKLPSRMTFGLNYHKGERPGSNISSSVLMASSHGAKSRSWLWGGAPIQRNGNSLILLSHMNKDRNDRSTPDYRLTLYGPGGELATTEGTLPNGCGVNIQMETLLEEAGVHLPVGAFVWYVVQSDNPSMISNQIHISESGAIGGDHSF